MEYLLDSHALLWFLQGDELLPEKVKAEIKNLDNKCFVSIASLWEIGIKTSLGKLTLEFSFEDLPILLSANYIEFLPVSFAHLVQLKKLDLHHKDPFDRVIIARGITENLTIVSKDENFKLYPGASIFWK